MIKKVNIILAVGFSLLLAMKGLKEIKDSRKLKSRSQETVATVRQEASGLAPCVCFAHWTGYSVPDPISNRNGVLLDIVRAIFPNATYRVVNGNAEDFAAVLREEPNAVVVGFGNHPALKEAVAAPTSIMACPLVLMTLRSNPWHYKGPSSLEGLRLIANEAYLDYKILQDMRERYGKDSSALRFMPVSTSKIRLAEMVEDGEADAFVMSGMKNRAGAVMEGDISAHLLHNFRASEPIAVEGTRFIVSGKDPELSKRMIDEFEKGLRRIDRSGERRRIFEYYGAAYDPLDDGKPAK